MIVLAVVWGIPITVILILRIVEYVLDKKYPNSYDSLW